MNKLVKTVNKGNLYYEYLNALNGILQLTNRRMIKSTMGITPDNLSRYISKFKKEGLLVQGKAEDELVVNKILIPEIIKDRVQITLILRVNE